MSSPTNTPQTPQPQAPSSSSKIHLLPQNVQLSQSFLSTLASLSNLTKPQLGTILNFTFGILRSQLETGAALDSDALASQLQEVLHTHNQQHTDANLDLSDTLPHAKCLLFIFNSTIQHELSQKQLISDLNQLGCSQMNASRIAKAFFLHAHSSLLHHHQQHQSLDIHNLNLNSVRDFEWRFGVIASSSEMARIGKPYVQMKFSLDGRNEPVYLELRVEQFYEFLHELEKAKAMGDVMSGY